jgi:hypothetical protein
MTVVATSNINTLPEPAQDIFYELISLGIKEEKAALIFYRPIGDGVAKPTQLQWINRSAFLRAEKRVKRAYQDLNNLKFSLFTLPRKRLTTQLAAVKRFEDSVDFLRVIYNDVLKSEQTKKWSYYKGNIYSNSYQYVQDGPWDMQFLPEAISLTKWEARLKIAKTELK